MSPSLLDSKCIINQPYQRHRTCNCKWILCRSLELFYTVEIFVNAIFIKLSFFIFFSSVSSQLHICIRENHSLSKSQTLAFHLDHHLQHISNKFSIYLFSTLQMLYLCFVLLFILFYSLILNEFCGRVSYSFECDVLFFRFVQVLILHFIYYIFFSTKRKMHFVS